MYDRFCDTIGLIYFWHRKQGTRGTGRETGSPHCFYGYDVTAIQDAGPFPFGWFLLRQGHPGHRGNDDAIGSLYGILGGQVWSAGAHLTCIGG